jgi:Flp pilus assembly protein CpaB
LTEFWERMREQFGAAYADSLAKDQVLSQLGGRSVAEALEAGEPVRRVWRAVCEAFDVPARNR